MLRIEFDLSNAELTLEIGHALVAYAQRVGFTDKVVVDTIDCTSAAGLTKADTIVGVLKTIPDEVTMPVKSGDKLEVVEVTGNSPDDELDATKTTVKSALTEPPVDEHGVPFDAAYCGTAKDPFYKSGKRKGQWKRRQGVDEAKYDLWHAEQVLAIPPPSRETEPAATVGL